MKYKLMLVLSLLAVLSLGGVTLADYEDLEFTVWMPGGVSFDNVQFFDCRGATAPIFWPISGYTYFGTFWHTRKSAAFNVGGIKGSLYACYPDMYPCHYYYACYPGRSLEPIGVKSLFFGSKRTSTKIDQSSWFDMSVDQGDSFGWYGSDFKQTDYKDQYGNGSPNITIKDLGCYLCCACNALVREGIEVTPGELNSWLRSNRGYANQYQVRLDKVVEWARKVKRVKLGYKICVPAEECVFRCLSAWGSVKSGRHWVSIAEFFGPLSMSDFVVLDPMSRTDHFKGYTGYSVGNTRALYTRWINGTSTYESPSSLQRTAAASIAPPTPLARLYLSHQSSVAEPKSLTLDGIYTASTDVQDELPGTAKPYYATGTIGVYTQSPVSVTLEKDARIIGSAEPFYLENATTGEEVFCGSSLEIPEQPDGQYNLTAAGTPGTSFNVNIVSDGRDGRDATEYAWNGVIGTDGKANYSFRHFSTVSYDDLGPIKDLMDGAEVQFPCALVTAVVPGGLYLQPLGYKLPVIFAPYTGNEIKSLNTIHDVEATVSGGKLILNKFYVSDYEQEKKPMAVSTSGVSGSLHLFVKVVGKVTSLNPDGVVLDGTCPVKFEEAVDALGVGQTISVKGVWHDGTFYAKSTRQMTSF